MPLIGRLHKIEAQKDDSFELNEKIQVKVLKVTQDEQKQLIELTRRKEHLDLANKQLDQTLVN